MSSMFAGCESLISVNLDNFDTQNVKDMNTLFGDCHSLKSIDTFKLNTKSVKHGVYVRWLWKSNIVKFI